MRKMMTVKTKILSSFAALALLAGGAVILDATGENTATAQAQSAKAVVDAAKARGTIGETASGYLAVSGNATAAETNAMNEINIGRKSVYTRLARKNNEQVDIVAAVTGLKQIEKAPAGQKVMGTDGAWKTK